MKNKKAQQMNLLENVIVSLVVVGFMLIIGLSLLSQAKNTTVDTTRAACGTNLTGGGGGTLLYTNCSAAYNASGTVISAIASIPGWLTVIVLAFIAVVVLGAVYMLKKEV